jgi:hypothetical protein
MAASDTESGANGKQAEPRHPLRRTDPSRATGGKKGAKPRFTAPAYWKFESTSLQRGVRSEPDSLPGPAQARQGTPKWCADIEQRAEPCRAEMDVDLIGSDIDALDQRGKVGTLAWSRQIGPALADLRGARDEPARH